jgi:hypothetical protein
MASLQVLSDRSIEEDKEEERRTGRKEQIKKKTPWFLVRKRTIPTERPQPVGEVGTNKHR